MNSFIPLLFKEIETRSNIESFHNLKFDHHRELNWSLHNFDIMQGSITVRFPIHLQLKKQVSQGTWVRNMSGRSWTTLKLSLCVISPLNHDLSSWVPDVLEKIVRIIHQWFSVRSLIFFATSLLSNYCLSLITYIHKKRREVGACSLQ